MSRPHQSRRLKLEHCEPRRMLSANPFDTGGQTINFSFSDSYLLAASSSGWTPIDADSDLVTVRAVGIGDGANEVGIFVQGGLMENGDGRVQIDLDQAFQRFEQSLGERVVLNGGSNVGLSAEFLGTLEPNLTDDFSFESQNDNFSVPTVPTDPIDRIGGDADQTVDPGPTDPPSTSVTVDDAGAKESIGETQPSPENDLPPRREPQGGLGVIERVVASSLPAGVERPGAGLIDLAQLLGPTHQPVAKVAAHGPQSVPATELSARDAALAVESWVRSIPATTPPLTGTVVPGETLRADEAEAPAPQKPAEATPQDRRPTTVQAGQPIQPVRSASHEAAGESSGEPVVVPVLDERSPTYRLAIAALSALMSGGLIKIVNRKTSRPGCLEHPRRCFEG